MSVTVWGLALNRSDAAEESAALMPFLDDATRRRVAVARTAASGWSTAAAHALVRVLLTRVIGGRPPAAWVLQRSPLGRPFVPGVPVDISLTHTDGFSACAVALVSRDDGDLRVGLDAESAGRSVEAERLARRFFHPAEASALSLVPETGRRAAFLRLWTMKEAVVKARGGGLQEGLETFHIGADGRLISAPESFGPVARWRLYPLSLSAETLAALAVYARTEPAVRETLFRDAAALHEVAAAAEGAP